MSNRRVLGTGGGGAAFSTGGTTANLVPKEDGSGGLKDSLISDSGTALTYNSKVVPSWTTGGTTTNTIPKTSGTAGLLADSLAVDTGTTLTYSGTGGIVSPAFVSSTANPSTTGIIRLANADSIIARNQLNNADLTLLSLSSGNQVMVAGAATQVVNIANGFFQVGNIATASIAAPWGIDSSSQFVSPPSATGAAAKFIMHSANTAQWVRAQNSELLTLSTSGLTTSTSGNLLPANSVIEAVVCRITTTITTTTNWAVGDATTTSRFSSANATLTANTTSVGLNHWSGAVTTLAAGPTQAAAAPVQITCTGANPGAGIIRITVFYRQFVAPAS